MGRRVACVLAARQGPILFLRDPDRPGSISASATILGIADDAAIPSALLVTFDGRGVPVAAEPCGREALRSDQADLLDRLLGPPTPEEAEFMRALFGDEPDPLPDPAAPAATTTDDEA